MLILHQTQSLRQLLACFVEASARQTGSWNPDFDRLVSGRCLPVLHLLRSWNQILHQRAARDWLLARLVPWRYPIFGCSADCTRSYCFCSLSCDWQTYGHLVHSRPSRRNFQHQPDQIHLSYSFRRVLEPLVWEQMASRGRRAQALRDPRREVLRVPFLHLAMDSSSWLLRLLAWWRHPPLQAARAPSLWTSSFWWVSPRDQEPQSRNRSHWLPVVLSAFLAPPHSAEACRN